MPETEPSAVAEAPVAAPLPAWIEEDVKAPISPDRPQGADVKYDDDVQQIKAEIDDIQPDFDRVIELGRKVLCEKSKDLAVAYYVVLALARTERFEGVRQGIGLVNVLLDTFWDGLYPAKPGRRKVQLQRLGKRLKDELETTLKDVRLSEADGAAIEQARRGVDALQALCEERLDGAPAELGGLAAALDRMLQRVPKPGTSSETPKPQASQAGVSQAPAASSGAGASAARREEGGIGAPTTATEAVRVVFQMAAFLRAKQPQSPVPYALARAARWGVLDQLPAAAIPAPEAARRERLVALAGQGAHAVFVEQAEQAFQEPPFHLWLDLQRHVLASLDALGAGYASVREAVAFDLALLVRRLGALPEQTFGDGTPYADAETRAWIDAEIRPLLGGSGASQAPALAVLPLPDNAQDPRLEERFGEAQARLEAGDLAGALSLMQDGARLDVARKDHFLRRLYQAELCLTSGRWSVARTLLEGLSEEMDRYAIDTWDPALAQRVWTRLYACYGRLVGEGDEAARGAIRERAAAVLERIGRQDPACAVALLEASG